MLILSTTGNTASVILNDLGGRTFTHPATASLLSEYKIEDLINSSDLSSSLSNNYVELDYDGNDIDDLNDLRVIDSPKREIIVKSIKDLPDPVGGSIDLSNDNYSIYRINGTVSLGTFSLTINNDVVFKGTFRSASRSNTSDDALVYTGTGSMFNSSSSAISIVDLEIKSPSGSVFNSNDLTSTKSIFAGFCTFENINSLGNISGYFMSFFDTCFFDTFNEGFSINDISNLFIKNNYVITTNPGQTFLSATQGSYNTIDIINNTIQFGTQSDIGFNISEDINLSFGGNLGGNSFVGGGIGLTGVSVATNDWTFAANTDPNITNSWDRVNTKVIRRLSNLPTPVNNVITLEEGFTYNINGLIDLGTNSIVTQPGNILFGNSRSGDGLIYNGTGSMITGTDGDFNISGLRLSSASGSVFDVSGDGTTSIRIDDCIIDQTQNIGQFTGYDTLTLEDNRFSEYNEGLRLYGSFNDTFFESNLFDVCRLSGTSTLRAITIDGASAASISFNGNHFDGFSYSIALSLTGSNFFTHTNIAVGNEFHDFVLNPLENVGVYSNGWFFSSNSNIEDTLDRENVKGIRHKDNLPGLSGSSYYLEDNTTYDFIGNIDIGTYSIYMGNGTKLTGDSVNFDKITYTGTGSAINSSNNDIIIDSIDFISPSGSAFNIKDMNPFKESRIIIKNCRFEDNDKLGYIENVKIIELSDNRINGTSSGITLTGTANGNFLYFDNINITLGGTLIDFGQSVWDIVTIDRNQIHVPLGSTGISGLTNSGNLNLEGNVFNNNFLEGGDFVAGIDIDGNKWAFIGNGAEVPNSSDQLATAGVFIDNNATATIITTASVPVPIQADAFSFSTLDRFSLDQTTGELTYTGLNEVNLTSDAGIYFSSDNGQSVVFYIAKNDTPLPRTKATLTTVGNTTTMYANSKGIITVANGDRLRIYVENTSTTKNILVENMNWST